MEDLEKTQRLNEILAKLDPRAETRVREGGLFKSAELLRRRLLHEGALFWKTPGSRPKGIQRWMAAVSWSGGWGGRGGRTTAPDPSSIKVLDRLRVTEVLNRVSAHGSFLYLSLWS